MVNNLNFRSSMSEIEEKVGHSRIERQMSTLNTLKKYCLASSNMRVISFIIIQMILLKISVTRVLNKTDNSTKIFEICHFTGHHCVLTRHMNKIGHMLISDQTGHSILQPEDLMDISPKRINSFIKKLGQVGEL